MNDAIQTELFPHSIGKRTIDAWFPKALEYLKIEEHGGWPDAFGDAITRWNKSADQKPVTAISLFSGAGGLDIGFHDAGFTILECNELEPKFAATLEKNSSQAERLHGSRIVCRDIREYLPSVSHADFIIGGPPCQTFSAAGARANGVNGTDDDRGNLFLQYARIIDRIKPAGFLFENVYRIVGAQGGKPWKQIQAAFRELGYTLHWRILDAADYGVPQFRERLIIVGLKNGTYKFPFPSHGPDSPDQHPYYTARNAVAGIDTTGCKVGIGGRHGYLLSDIPPGLNYSFYTERLGHPTPLFGWRSKFSDYLYKADPDTPVRTIKAQGGQYTGPFSWENRPFSVEELKRLQTFPDNYSVTGNRQTIVHQLGNSVPPQLARVLALSILNQVFGRKLPFAMQLMEEHHQLKFRSRKSELTAVYANKANTAISRLPKQEKESFKRRVGTTRFSLSSDLRMIVAKGKQHEFSCKYTLTKDAWSVSLSEQANHGDDDLYTIVIKPPLQNGSSVNSLPPFTQLSSQSGSAASLLAVWKFYEHLVRTHASKDDLVQLFGYYQYKNAFSISMHFSSEALSTSLIWRVISIVTNGSGVGSIYPIDELAAIYGITQKELHEVFSQLKELGFEIRNHRTNKQIPAGFVLVPYSFPTLNERSLQRLTRL
jgi:DNA (cytosine-5)-methyltransferase 1